MREQAKSKSNVLMRVVIGIILGLMLCVLGYLLLVDFMKVEPVTKDWTYQYEVELSEVEKKEEKEETKEETKQTGAAQTSKEKEVTITAVKANNEEVKVTDPNASESDYFTMMQEGIRYFQIVYPEASKATAEVAKAMNDKIAGMTGFELPSIDDGANSNVTYEILLGDTKRTESKEAASQLEADGYVIAVKNNKIAIVGSSAYSLRKGVEAFLSSVESANGSMKVKKAIHAVQKSGSTFEGAITSKEDVSAKTGLVFEASLPGATPVVQGGYTDGTYFYQALIDMKENETENDVVVMKYDMQGNVVSKSEVMKLNHANDITYNSKLGYFVVCHNGTEKSTLSYLDPVSLTVAKTFQMDYNIYAIDYNAKMDQYVIGLSGGQSFRILDGNFKAVGREIQPTDKAYGYTTQGVSCDSQFIYFALFNPNAIAVYDWEGNFVSLVTLDLTSSIEVENISVVGSNIYLGTKDWTTGLFKVYKVTSFE